MLRDSAGNMLVDALGQPINYCHPGYAFAILTLSAVVEDRDYAKG